MAIQIRRKEVELPLSLRPRLMIDYLARQRFGQSAMQIAVGITEHPFFLDSTDRTRVEQGMESAAGAELRSSSRYTEPESFFGKRSRLRDFL